MSKFINPFTDFGFKYVFGDERSKPYLIDFLNGLLINEKDFDPIINVTYVDKEKNRIYKENRGVVYDILCDTEDGRHFIVEMQNSKQPYFIDRSIFYMSRAIFDQGTSGGEWNYGLEPVYIVSFLNFNIDVFGDSIKIDAGFCNLANKKLLTNKIRFVYIQLPQFKETNPDNCKDVFSQ